MTLIVPQARHADPGAAGGAGGAGEHVHGVQRVLGDTRTRPGEHDRRPLGESTVLLAI